MIKEATITRDAVEVYIRDVLKENNPEDVGGLSESMLDDVVDAFMDRISDPKSGLFNRVLEDFMEDASTDDVIALHKKQGRYKREEWYHEGDKYCSECDTHLLAEDAATEGVKTCPKCGEELIEWEGW